MSAITDRFNARNQLIRNLVIATTSAVAMQLVEQPLAKPLAALVERRR